MVANKKGSICDAYEAIEAYYTEARVLPNSICLRVAHVPRSQDTCTVIFVLTTTMPK